MAISSITQFDDLDRLRRVTEPLQPSPTPVSPAPAPATGPTPVRPPTTGTPTAWPGSPLVEPVQGAVGTPKVPTALPGMGGSPGGVDMLQHAISQGWVTPGDPRLSPEQAQRAAQTWQGAGALATQMNTGTPGSVVTPVTGMRPQVGPVQGPGVDALGLPTVGSAGQVNDQLLDLFRRMQGFQGVAPGSGPLPEDFGRAREFATGGEFSPVGDEGFNRLFRRFTSGGGPRIDRVALAQKAIDRRNEARQPILDRNLREVGQKAAALGRVGAGMTTNDLTDVFSREADAERRFSEGVIDEALRGSAEDAARRASLRASVGTNLAGLGQRAREFATGTLTDLGQRELDEFFRRRGEGRVERDTAFGQDLATFGAGRGLSGDLFGQEQSVRGERRQLARDALNDRIQGTLLEDQLAGNEFNRALQRAQLLLGTAGLGSAEGNDLLNTFFM